MAHIIIEVVGILAIDGGKPFDNVGCQVRVVWLGTGVNDANLDLQNILASAEDMERSLVPL